MEVVEVGDAAQAQMAGFVVVEAGFRIVAVEVGIATLAGEDLLKAVVVLHDIPGRLTSSQYSVSAPRMASFSQISLKIS